MSTEINFTCPKCGAGHSHLKNIPKRERKTSNPLFFFKCSCGYVFDLRTRHCRQIAEDVIAMEQINKDFFSTPRAATMLTSEGVRI
jgi:uncharacterized Zn finger protein